jgi:hypothetical protein
MVEFLKGLPLFAQMLVAASPLIVIIVGGALFAAAWRAASGSGHRYRGK